MNHQDLDQQIRQALDVEPSPESLERLERFWHDGQRAQRRRRRVHRAVAWAAAVAAVLLVGALAAVPWFGRSGEQTPVAGHDRRQAGPSVDEPKAGTQPTEPSQPGSPAKSPSAGRAPTAYEQVLFAARSRLPVAVTLPALTATHDAHHGDSAVAHAPRPPEDDNDRRAQSTDEPRTASAERPATEPAKAAALALDDVDRLIARAIDEPEAEVRWLVLDSGLAGPRLEHRLLGELRRGDEPRRRAVIRLLGACGTRRSVPSLLQLAHSGSLRDEALAGIEQIKGPETLLELLPQVTDARVRAGMMDRVLRSESDEALRGYLALVQNESTRAEALAVADSVSGPLLDRLMRALDDGQRPVRFSAALVLGHANGPQVATALIDLVTSRPADSAEDARRTEAWIALMGCQSRQTGEFLAYASWQPQLLKYVNRARNRLDILTFHCL